MNRHDRNGGLSAHYCTSLTVAATISPILMQRLLFALILTAVLFTANSEKSEKSSTRPARRRDTKGRATPISAADLFKTYSKSATAKLSGQQRSPGEGNIEASTITAATSTQNTCKAFDVCFSNEDCHGGECVGAFVGKCNCNACLDFWLCESDAACGGLKGACNTITKTCDCNAGFKAAGFNLYVDALNGLCNKKSCTQENAAKECHGLPCHYGRCMCM